MKPDLENIKKIAENLQSLKPETTEVELLEIAENLYRISLFLIRLKIKEVDYFKQPKNNSP